MAYDKKAEWTDINPEELPEDIKAKFMAYKQAYKQAKDLRTWFEDLMRDQAALPEGKKLVFGYNFGKLSLAVVDDDQPKRAPAKPKQSLAEYLAAQRASGFQS